MRAWIALLAVVTTAGPAAADELMTVRSTHPVTETLNRMEAAATSAGFFIVARIDHAAQAEKVGLTLRPTAVLVFGKAQGGTPLMQCDQRIGIDLPLKALAWQDETGQVWLAMVDPAVFRTRYGLGDRCDGPIAAVQAVERGLLATAVQ